MPNVKWYKEEQVLEDSATVTMENNRGWGYLKVKSAKSADAGSYRITAENSAGKDQAEFRVVIKCKKLQLVHN